MNSEVARLKEMLERDLITDEKHDVISRRIFAIEHEIVFTNPFGQEDEFLYKVSKIARKPPREFSGKNHRRSN